MPMRRWATVAWTVAATVAIALLAVDRYSLGQVGGHGLPQYRWWQSAVAAALAVLVGAGTVAGLRQRPIAKTIVRLEAVLFLGINVLYVLRDGQARISWGYEHAMTGAWLLVGGGVARLALTGLSLVAANRHDQPSAGERPGG